MDALKDIYLAVWWTVSAWPKKVKKRLSGIGEAVKPFVFQRREPLTRMMKGIDDLETKDVKFMTEARYNVGYFAWWTSILCTLTT